MKKLMMVVAIVCAAIATQAASVDWGLTSKNTIMNAAGGSAGGYTVYLLDSSVTKWSDTLAGLADGTIKASNIDKAAGYMDSGTLGSSGAGIGKMVTDTATVSDAGLTFSKLVFVAFDKQGGTDYYYLSQTRTGTSYDGSAEYPSGTKAAWTSSDYSSSNWHSVGGPEPTPEPTSGLLLLVGMAGLALRRRRA